MMLKKNKFILICIIISALFFGCTNIEKNITVNIELIKEYGKKDSSELGLFGFISSFTVDSEENLYIADKVDGSVKKYSSSGELLMSFGKGIGRGPQEFQSIHNLCIDTLFNLYVLDKFNLKISVFNKNGNGLKEYSLPFMPAQIISNSYMIVDIVGFPFRYEGNLINRFNLFNEGNTAEKTFCMRLTDKNSKLGLECGNSGRLSKDANGNIYYCYYYPFRIEKFNRKGEFLFSINGEKEFKSPYKNSKNGMIETPEGVREFAVLSNDILLFLVQNKKNERVYETFDFYNSVTGEFIGEIDCAKLGLANIRYLKSDLNGNIYVDYLNPYPHIRKYKLSIVNNSK